MATPKSSILMGFSLIDHPFGGTPHFRKPPFNVVTIIIALFDRLVRHRFFAESLGQQLDRDGPIEAVSNQVPDFFPTLAIDSLLPFDNVFESI